MIVSVVWYNHVFVLSSCDPLYCVTIIVLRRFVDIGESFGHICLEAIGRFADIVRFVDHYCLEAICCFVDIVGSFTITA